MSEIEQRLNARLPKGHRAELRHLNCGPIEVPLWCVADPAALSDALDPAEFEKDERFPYWAELWPASAGMATYLAEHGRLDGVKAIELGCGLALAGMAASFLGADVLYTDFEPDALFFAEQSHLQNFGQPGKTLLLDWRDPPENLQCELVLAADVLYERRFLDPFIQTLKKLLPNGGTALVSEPGRMIAASPLKRLESEGFDRELIAQTCIFEGQEKDIWIHKFTRL